MVKKTTRFDYVKYDDKALLIQDEFKQRVFHLEQAIDTELSSPRAKAIALTKLEEVYMWIGKAIRDDQIIRNDLTELNESRR